MAIDTNFDFTPQKVTGIFTKYMAKTLPLAFDESMSYYECLCALLEYLNTQISPSVNNVNDKMSELVTYMNTYFDNLDVQEEINNKLDEMVEDGTLTTIIESYINPYLTTFNDRLNKQDNKINALSIGAPLVASSTSEMTDTTRVYVNTTNGKWYYYDGDSWKIGGTYQASENSTLVNNIDKYTSKMAKTISGNTIYLTKDNTNFTITTKNDQDIYFVTENKHIICPVTNINKVFPLSDYDLSISRWVLYIRNKESFLGKLSTVTLKYDDIILCIITPQTIISLVDDYLIYNNNNLGRCTIYKGYNVPIDSYNRLDVTNDTENKTFTISAQSNAPVMILNKAIQQIPANKTQTLSYDITLTNSNIIGIVYNYELGEFRIVQLLRFIDKRGYIQRNDYDTCLYGDVLIFTYNIATHRIIPFINQFYYNNELISDDKIYNEITNLNNKINLLNTLNKYDFLRCFKNFTFIGDSLTAGYTSVDGHTINSATAREQNNNWPSYLCSRLNREFTNLGFGSSTIHNWRYGDQQGQDTNINLANIKTGIYFVGLGVNDLRGGLTVGSSSDINTSDYTKNVDSVYGNYDFIINKLKSFNPYAKIFVFTIPNSENNPKDINNAIKYVANLYNNVYCIDLNTLYDYNSGFIADNFTNEHYNPITYNYMSLLIEKAINDYIFNNPTEFDLVPYNFN